MKNLLFKNWKTTAVAVLSLLATLFVTAGTLTPDESVTFKTLAHELFNSIEGIVATIMGIVLLFAKDPDTKTLDE